MLGRRGIRRSAPQFLLVALAIGLAFVLMAASRAQSSSTPIGFHDGNSDVVGETWRCSAFGWTVDPDNVDRDLDVQVLSDGEVVATTVANLPRADLTECTGGSCSFNVPLFELITANEVHSITVQAWDEETGAWVDLSGTPKTLKCMGYPEGWHDGVEGEVSEAWQCNATGWAVDPERRGDDVRVTIFSDGEMVAEGLASDYRDGLEGVCVGGTCSFSFDLFDRITSGVQHAISAQAHDDETIR